MVYSKLAVANVGGTAHPLIKQYEDDNNGYRECKDFCEWYDGNCVRKETVYPLRYDLEFYHLTLASK